jgi:hypothetical protein
MTKFARDGGGVRAAGVGLPVFTRLASNVCARGQRDVASGWRRNGGGGGGGVPSEEGLWVFGPRGIGGCCRVALLRLSC